MGKFCIFVGDSDNSLIKTAASFDNNAVALTNHNCQAIQNRDLSKDLTVYTSLSHMSNNLCALTEICLTADKIVYCAPVIWSDNKTVNACDPTASVQGLTENLLLLLSQFVEVVNLEIDHDVLQPIPVVDHRKTQDKQLWIAGCSISHGEGVEPNQRYGHMLANDLGLECSFLTRPGAAIDWICGQVLRSDVRKDDIVILALPNIERLTFVHNAQLAVGVTVRSYLHYPELENLIPKKNLVSENTFYHHVETIEQTINFCNKAQAHLLILGLLSSFSNNLTRYSHTKRNFFLYPHSFDYNRTNNSFDFKFTDLGTDHLHPGPQQHQQYKKFILAQLKNLHLI